MALRQLSKEEKDLNTKSINRLTEQNKVISYNLKKLELERDFGLELLHKQKTQQVIDGIKEAQTALKNNVDLIDTLIKQNTKGVEIKKIDKEDKNTYTG